MEYLLFFVLTIVEKPQIAAADHDLVA